MKPSTEQSKRDRYTNILPSELRGDIKGTVKYRRDPLTRKGGEMTNADYAKENGITKRQASKLRRGY